MKINNQDITTIAAPAVIIHGVNCQRTMQSGVAKAISDKWPIVKWKYLEIPQENMQLGMVMPVRVDQELYVMNCWTQSDFGYDKAIYADVSAINQCLQQTAQFCLEAGIHAVYSPPIGCGLGGLNFVNDVFPLFIDLSNRNPNLNITICDHKPRSTL